jgi:LacI family transcriptional regulator
MPRRRATSKDVADLAGVSRTTVSFVLNKTSGMRIGAATRLRVLRAAQRLNYHPDATARRMAGGRTFILGFVLRQSPEQAFNDHFLPQVLTGLSCTASEHGYHILFETIAPGDHSGAYARLVRERHVDGIVLSGPRSDDRELRAIDAEGAPIVLMGKLSNSRIPSVDVDNVKSAAMATEHLVRLGHRRIGIITNAPVAYTASADRLKGYRSALRQAGIPYDRSLVSYGNFTPQSGLVAMKKLLASKPHPSAIFVASDTVALGALQELDRRNLRVPKDISLIGCDDIPLAEFIDPPLTTIRLPASALGRAAANLLISLIDGEKNAEREVLLDTELIVRSSTASPA